MCISNGVNSRLSFLGQNSHGSHESWVFRKNYINMMPSNSSLAIVFECPTVDLIIFSMKRGDLSETLMRHYLSSSTYWWMRTREFRHFIENLPSHAEIYGIDVPLVVTHHLKYISSLAHCNFPESQLLQHLLKLDVASGNTISTASPEIREGIMTDKLLRILNAGYREVVVICHNFHATRCSWLPINSLCQRLVANVGNVYSITSIGVFSENMTFVATPDGQSLREYTLLNACTRHDKFFQVKMVSSFFRSEVQDALPLRLMSPKHYDKVIVYKTGAPVKLEYKCE